MIFFRKEILPLLFCLVVLVWVGIRVIVDLSGD
jgi:hypothetical protein